MVRKAALTALVFLCGCDSADFNSTWSENEIRELASDVAADEMSGVYNDSEFDPSGLESRISDLETAKTSAESEVASLEAEIARLEAEMASMRSEYEDHRHY